MQVEAYSKKYWRDIVAIVENFYNEALSEYNDLFDKEAVMYTIDTLDKNPATKAFLLIIEGKCEGLFVGMQIPSLYNKKKIFQELIWYVNVPHRKHGVHLLNHVREALKSQGFNMLIMGVMENSKTDAIKRLYEREGFRFFESHWIKEL